MAKKRTTILFYGKAEQKWEKLTNAARVDFQTSQKMRSAINSSIQSKRQCHLRRRQRSV